MGTRADFYIGRGEEANWIGSIAWDGYPDGINPEKGNFPKGLHLFDSSTVDQFKERVGMLFEGREDVTLPHQGWPWPWEDSRTTDYAYAFDGGTVWASRFGHEWFEPKQGEPENEGVCKVAIFPDMSKTQQREKFGPHSGVILLSAE